MWGIHASPRPGRCVVAAGCQSLPWADTPWIEHSDRTFRLPKTLGRTYFGPDRRINTIQGAIMNLVRIVFIGLAVLLPTAWTVAKANDEAGSESKTTKKTKKSKKADGTEKTETETKTEKTDKTEK
jgi:hypothetical protein